MAKSIRVQGVLWEEHSGTWFSELGMIEKMGSQWWYSLVDEEGEVGPFLNPSQAAKDAAIQFRRGPSRSAKPGVSEKDRAAAAIAELTRILLGD